jgi:tetratricopeptide (TPR) repeat protein
MWLFPGVAHRNAWVSYDAVMRALVVVCLLAGRAFADPIVAIAPPSADSPSLAEAGLLMQAEAGRWLLATQRKELHVKQLLRALERHHITLEQLSDPEVAARVASVLGAPVFVYGKLTAAKGGWLLEVRVAGEKGASMVPLGTSLVPAIEAGARALESAVAKDNVAASLGTTNEDAVSSYGACYAVLIRQPISVESPTMLSAAELTRAVKSCRAAVAADPGFERAWAALGLALAIAGQDAEAIQALLKVHGDKSYLPLYWLGRYWLVTRYQSADAGLTALQQATKQYPGFLLARGYLGEHLMATGKFADALDVWLKYSAELPKNAFLRGRVSAALARLGRHEEAIAAAKLALEFDRSDADAILELGSRYLDAGKRDEAIQVLQPAANGNSRGELLLRLGWAYFEKGDLGRAEALFRRAEQTTAPGDWRTRARARADLARVFDSRGDASGAETAIRHALEEGGGAYLRTQRDRRIVELVDAAEKAPSKVSGPRLVKPTELSPFPIDPAGDIDLRARQFPAPPKQFELIRF